MSRNSAMFPTSPKGLAPLRFASFAIASKAFGASLLFLVVTSCGKQQPEAQAPPPAVRVEVKDLNSKQVRSSSEFVGSLEAKRKVALAPRVDGRILEIAVQEGDSVKQGDLIVRATARAERTRRGRSSKVRSKYSTS